ncbi:type II toxin-antitoxin system RelE/ParE family toxin [Paludisphaera mucosa]|uniref:Type II toxin-antitoxin system RelE/ParE family toxin n=1 Tax=Paludisphaera mucosa TaxID=3030827 RepID=A0ABT6FJR4_9BACT|nr:type II toxin-antitoxin system RelE/ParE family toxin [Paludisphaera mucosa]MDG3007822.1 type II toxin-antitoxin system RelE/ParE family toxin [Paludisphaera mucosa]
MNDEIELTRRAVADLDRLAASLDERRPDGVGRLTERFFEALSRLESFPLSCGLAYEDRHFPGEVRHLLFRVFKGRPYRALFTIQGDKVRGLAVRAPGERPVGPEELES